MPLSCLPEDIQVDIFLKLPLNSISSCRCVCKVWCSLLSSPKFIKTHTIQNSKNNPRLIILQNEILSGRSSSIYSVEYDTISSAVASATWASFVYLEPVIRMDFPYEYSKQLRYMDIIGSCNGLVCLTISFSGDGGDMENTFILWNPTTREYKSIPCHFVNRRIECKVVVGFGYDLGNDDYKVVRLIDYNQCGSLRVDIYTLRSNSWETAEKQNCYMFRTQGESSGLLFNGALHWPCTKSTGEMHIQVIVSFDVSNDTLVDFPLPELLLSGGINYGHCMSVGVLRDRLCLAINVGYFRTDLWVMQDYGVGESWTKLFSAQFHGYLRPCLCLGNGDVLMNSHVGLVWFEKNNGKPRYMEVDSKRYTHSPCGFVSRRSELQSYVCSLVSLDSGTHVGQNPTNGNTMVEEN